eukprot:CAMPEP_0175224616 /NCGR_PEP_ID=MMETSP0093-20121207/21942_1 /TAXON_ID=311494 /ORGANISM="Alexandrium monilatum, Strain CCMP3105" /LENGTH=253 /DNA_ID=CAMNT_0016518261 /DNA_START=65 /DNA_END=826 /DNA_ORIENTATION=+
MSGCFSGCFGGIKGSKAVPGKVKLVYWPILAKNIAPAIALEVGGFDWEMAPGPGSKGTGNLWAEWLEMKPTTVWGFLPNVELSGGTRLGSELAILQFIARKVPALAGANEKEMIISQELLHHSEELYQKVTARVPTMMEPDKDTEVFRNFMTGADATTHSKNQGLQVYLTQFENFYTKCGGKLGKMTSSGTTIGEIKLYATLKLLLLVQGDLLASYPNLTAFMGAYEANPTVNRVMTERCKGLKQYFISPPTA